MSASEADRIAVAQAYIDALTNHDGDTVAFAPGCTRVEFGLKTGFSGKQMRRDLSRGPQYRVIKSTTVPEYTVDGDHVRAVYDLVTKPSIAGRRVGVHLDETFLIPASDGQIHDIRVVGRPFLAR